MISENKLKHSLGVARKCACLAKQDAWPEEKIHAAFIMGLLHDIGYEYLTPDMGTEQHPAISVEMLDAFVKYIPEIREAIATHGTCSRFSNDFSRILNEADLTTGYDGQEMTINERIAGIIGKHGISSKHTQHALAMKNLIENTKED